MIPPRMLQELTKRLTNDLKAGKCEWQRDRQDVQRYIYPLNNGQIQMRYDPSRGGADTIELVVVDIRGDILGSLIGAEGDANFDLLADLVFEVQRATDRGGHRAVTDEILELLKS